MGELSGYWNDAKAAARKKRDALSPKRFAFAKKAFTEAGIPFEVKDESKGHFNLMKDGKAVMSFWSYTGKAYILSTRWSRNIGIKGCIAKYKKIFGEEGK